MKILLFDLLPGRCLKRLDAREKGCLKRSIKYKMFEEGEKKLQEEIDIVRILRDQRWLISGMKAFLRK